MLLNYLGDALWVVALAIMAGASRDAWRRIAPDARVPMRFHTDGTPTYRVSRRLALIGPPLGAFVVGLLFFVVDRRNPVSGDTALILFGVRATLAAVFALAHLTWLKAAMAALDKEGALKP